MVNTIAIAYGMDAADKAAKFYGDLSKEDVAYIEAVMRCDYTTANQLIGIAARRAMPNTICKHLVYRRDNDIVNEYKVERKGNKFRGGSLGNGVYFYGSKEESDSTYGYGYIQRPFYINVEKVYEMHTPEHEVLSLRNDGRVSSRFTKVVDSVGDGNEYDGIFFPMRLREEWCVLDPRRIKLATVTKDNRGVVIPLSYRFDFTNPDVRF